MAASPTRPTIVDSTNYIRRIEDVHVFFVPYNVLKNSKATPDAIKPVGILCTAENMDNPGLALLNEREVQTIGKKRAQTNDGYELSPFNLTVRGNTIKDVAALTGQNMNSAGSYSFKQIVEYGLVGALIVTGYDKDSDTIRRQDTYTNVNMKVEEMPGSGETYNITFYSMAPKIFSTIAPMITAVEVWFDDGASITNAAAIAANFDLSTGNDSVQTAGVDTDAVLHDSGGTAAGQYFFAIYQHGVEVDLTNTTYTPAAAGVSLGNFAPPAANAANDYLVAIYPFYKDQAGYTSTEVPGVRGDLLLSAAKDVNGGSFQDFNNFIGEL